MDYTFSNCHSIEVAPIIPEGVETMNGTFVFCQNLTTVSIIPSSVKNISAIFSECYNLTGTIEINANPTNYGGAFGYTEKPITLTGSSNLLDEIAATSTYYGSNGFVSTGNITILPNN